MKRLFLLLLLFVPLLINAQRTYKVDSIRVPNGTDTTVYIKFFTDASWSIQFDFKDFDAADAILDIGAVAEPDSTIFDRIDLYDSGDLPYVLADSSVTFQKGNWPHRYIAIKLTKTSVTAGLQLYYWITKQ
jgi:hypothetical protein